MKCKISIIIPVYNAGKYLEKCLESILKQTLKEFEILLINDGSTDNSKNICKEYCKLDNRIKFFDKENGGVSTARNIGLDNAEGEYIIFVDADDRLEQNTLEKMFSHIKRNNVDIAIAGRIIDYVDIKKELINKLGRECFATTRSDIADCVFYLNKQGEFDVLWNKIYRTEFLFKIQARFEIFATTSQDLLFNAKVFKHATSIQLVDEAYYHYVKRSDESIVTRYHKNIYEIMTSRDKALRDLFYYFKLSNKEHQIWLSSAFIRTMNVCIINMYRKGCMLNLDEKIKFVKENILKDPKIQKSVKICLPETKHDKIFIKLYKTSNPTWIVLIYKVMMLFRTKFKNLYLLIRK